MHFRVAQTRQPFAVAGDESVCGMPLSRRGPLSALSLSLLNVNFHPLSCDSGTDAQFPGNCESGTTDVHIPRHRLPLTAFSHSFDQEQPQDTVSAIYALELLVAHTTHTCRRPVSFVNHGIRFRDAAKLGWWRERLFGRCSHMLFRLLAQFIPAGVAWGDKFVPMLPFAGVDLCGCWQPPLPFIPGCPWSCDELTYPSNRQPYSDQHPRAGVFKSSTYKANRPQNLRDPWLRSCTS